MQDLKASNVWKQQSLPKDSGGERGGETGTMARSFSVPKATAPLQGPLTEIS